MNRRDFLKLSGAVSVALLFQISPLGRSMNVLPSAQAKGETYRGTPDGKIYVLAADGKTWQLLTNFGPEYSIIRMGRDLGGQVYARLSFAGRRFDLNLLEDGKSWRLA